MAEILKRPKSRQYDVTDVGRFAPRGEKQKAEGLRAIAVHGLYFIYPK